MCEFKKYNSIQFPAHWSCSEIQRQYAEIALRPIFSYKLPYIVGFGLVEMAISTNPKPAIYRNLYEDTGSVAEWAWWYCILALHGEIVCDSEHCVTLYIYQIHMCCTLARVCTLYITCHLLDRGSPGLLGIQFHQDPTLVLSRDPLPPLKQQRALCRVAIGEPQIARRWFDVGPAS